MDQLSIPTSPWIEPGLPQVGPPLAAATSAAAWLENVFSAAPALVIGIAALALVPVLVILGGLIRWQADRLPPAGNGSQHLDDNDTAGHTQRVTKKTEIRAVYRDDAGAEEADDGGIATQALRKPPRPMGGVVTVLSDVGSGQPPQSAPRQLEFGRTTLMRIGREPDNELVLTEPTVHRYHAAIERTLDAGYVITDLSGDKGNGVLVNARRITKAQLGDGDEIRLGAAVLGFSLRKQ